MKDYKIVLFCLVIHYIVYTLLFVPFGKIAIKSPGQHAINRQYWWNGGSLKMSICSG